MISWARDLTAASAAVSNGAHACSTFISPLKASSLLWPVPNTTTARVLHKQTHESRALSELPGVPHNTPRRQIPKHGQRAQHRQSNKPVPAECSTAPGAQQHPQGQAGQPQPLPRKAAHATPALGVKQFTSTQVILSSPLVLTDVRTSAFHPCFCNPISELLHEQRTHHKLSNLWQQC